MTTEAIILVGRETADAREVFRTHAERLRDRGEYRTVRVATYEDEPVRELRDRLSSVRADRSYAVPMTVAHDYDTTDGVPAALSYLDGEVRYCEPVGTSPAVTAALTDRAGAVEPAGEDATLVLVGFGSSSKPYGRQAAEYHAARIREESDYGAVLTCFLLQNPAVECARYNVSTPRAVAVPLFATECAATERRIPAELELDRGGIGYADPLGTHPAVTRAVHAEVQKQRALATAVGGESDAAGGSFEDRLAEGRLPVATDGEGT